MAKETTRWTCQECIRVDKVLNNYIQRYYFYHRRLLQKLIFMTTIFMYGL